MPLVLTRIKRQRSIPIPFGLIVPYNSLTLPTEGSWTWWNMANGSFLVGAGSTYEAGESGAGTVGSGTFDVVAVGDHSPDTDLYFYRGAVTPQTGGWSTTGGDHTHAISFDCLPGHQNLRMIKSLSIQHKFPANAVLLSDKNLISETRWLTNVFADGNYLAASASSISSTATAFTNTACAANGSHDHHYSGYDVDWGDPDTGFYNYSDTAKGYHGHSVSPTIDSDDIKKAYLMAWTATTGFYGFDGAIAMWESTGLPDGWALCDGNNGTVDLRDYFIMLDDETNVGTTEGDNTLTYAGTLTSGGSHNHSTSVVSCPGDVSGFRHSTNYSHAHDIDEQVSYLPPYYAVKFIQFSGRF